MKMRVVHEAHQDFTYYEKKAKGSAYCPNIAIDIKKLLKYLFIFFVKISKFGILKK